MAKATSAAGSPTCGSAQGIRVEGKTVIDATNRIGVGAPDGFASNAEFVKFRTGGPTAKSFNVNCASLYGRLGEARVKPSIDVIFAIGEGWVNTCTGSRRSTSCEEAR